MMFDLKLILLAAVLIALGGSHWYMFERGATHGEANVQAEWDKSKADAEARNKELREEGYELAAEYEEKLHALEKRYARTDAKLRAALNEPVQCPTSGRVGDVLLPASLVDSMFNREATVGDTAGPASAKPDATVQ